MQFALDNNKEVLSIVGSFSLKDGIPAENVFLNDLRKLKFSSDNKPLRVDLSGLEGDREGMLIACQRIRNFMMGRDIVLQWENVPEAIRSLWLLVTEKSPAAAPTRASAKGRYPGYKLVQRAQKEGKDFSQFVGMLEIEAWRMFTGSSRLRWGYFMQRFRECSIDALPITSLIAVLIGLILAYISAVQLVKFGASMYVADLVGVAIVREMGPVMIAIIMAGRTGAAYAAEIGTMKVSQEVDALDALGVSAVEYLVFPRLLALILALPMLILYGNVLGVLSGGIVANTAFEINFVTYIGRVRDAVSLTSLFGGLIKGAVFGFLIGFAGTWRGMQCGSSSSEVGRVTTSAVVTAITWIILVDALFAVMFNLYGIW
jgi:phospholipid/cholesterol/gamma-HCH transport system permease protein